MPVVSFDVPEGALSALHRTPDEFVNEMRLAAAIHWYSRGLISQGRGAEIASLSRREFLEALHRAEVPACQVTIEELKEEVERDVQTRRELLAPDPAGEGRTS